MSVRAAGANGTGPAEPRSVVVGTAGHIDHGKTALVRALTGTDTDRLPEEKARGITIDLGFAAFELTGPDGARFEVSLIDVPGHHAFVRNMLAGAGGIDCVLLVVAADEGVKPQTVEHLQICRFLGIRRGLVVLTKADAVGAERIEAVRGEVARLVEGTFLQGAPVLPVSAWTGHGMGELMAALTRLVAGVPQPSPDRVARLPVDRVFSMRGFGTVVTGTLQAGEIRTGESLRLEPGGRAVRVRGVQVHGRARAGVSGPNRVALNMAGVKVGEVRRGDTAVRPGTLEPVSVVDVEVEVMRDFALRHRQQVRVHAFASETLATPLLYPGEAGEGGQLARLRLVSPIVFAPGDRFVLRLPSPAVTIGGGRVLDGHPLPRLKKAAAAAWLRELRKQDAAGEVLLRVGRRGVAGLRLDRLVAETGWSRKAVGRMLRSGVERGVMILGAGGEAAVGAAALAEVEDRLWQEVGRTKKGSVPVAELRGKVGVENWVFALALGRLRSLARVELRGESLVLAGGGTGGLDERTGQIEEVYRTAGLASPSVSEAANKLRMGAGEMREAVTALLRAGKLVRLGSDALLVHAEVVERLKADLRTHQGETFDVGRFKSFTGLTRKHAIPLLEYLDGARVTRSVGAVRIVN